MGLNEQNIAFLEALQKRQDFIYSNQQETYSNFIEERKEEIEKKAIEIREKVDKKINSSMRNIFNRHKARRDDYSLLINKYSKYPIGFCGEITQKGFIYLEKYFKKLNPNILFKPVYGIYYSKKYNSYFFQNAYQLGNYFLSIANNTLNLDGSPTELNHISTIKFQSFSDLNKYVEVIGSYWKLKVLINPDRNTFFKFPIILLNDENDLILQHQLPATILLSLVQSNYMEVLDLDFPNDEFKEYLSKKIQNSSMLEDKNDLISFLNN